ncbi:MAG: hypothetical protein EXR72_23460 [Myxococcales bacterium]|nr:hypothetical protein [Myxococcales bacterium]
MSDRDGATKGVGRAIVLPGAVILVGLSTVSALVAAALLPPEEPVRARLCGALLGVGGVALAIHLAALGAIGRGIALRLRRIAARHEGELRAPIDDRTGDEVAALGRTIEGTRGARAEAILRAGASAGEVAGAAAKLDGVVAEVTRGAVARRREATETATGSAELAKALADLTLHAEAVHDEARAAGGSMTHISTVADGLTRSVDESVIAVQSSAVTVAAIVKSIAEVAGRASEVSGVALSTSSAILELNATIHRVRQTAEAAAGLAQNAGTDAERGQTSLSETMDGIDRIRATSRAIGEVTVGLERRAREIGVVLQLVGDLTERTNLLALNASIIAAQAGVEGRGFAVVASEIKNLAHRTAASAGEIAGLVAGVEEDVRAARRAAALGEASVEEGSERARATALTLSEIFLRVRESAQLSLSIAASTEEQARASSYVAEAMSRVTSSVDLIARGTSDQIRQGELLTMLTGRLGEIIRSVGDAARQQRDGAERAARAIGTAVTSVGEVAVAQRARAVDGEKLSGALTALRAGASEQAAAVGGLGAATEEVGRSARALAEALARLDR